MVIVTEWKEFRTPDFEAIKGALRTPVVFDGRNLYEPAVMANFGLEYHCIGLASARHRDNAISVPTARPAARPTGVLQMG